MLTAQAIKDQEFQIKFRGYDAIEVKAYLEQLAEDFFELGEQNRVQAEEIEALLAEQQSLQQEKDGLIAEYQHSQQHSEGFRAELDAGYEERDREIAALQERLEAAQATLADLEEERRGALERAAELEAKLSEPGMPEHEELAKLRARNELLEEQLRELKQEGVDFKTTILAAQKFADNLRQTAAEEARQLLAAAQVEVEQFRRQAEAELARLPKEIESLRQKKVMVRNELKAVLTSYLNSLEALPETGEEADDLADLFQTFHLPEEDIAPQERPGKNGRDQG